MSWVHDSGYGPAYSHAGHPVAVQIDGKETTGGSAATAPEVIGWRSACDCGWRGMQIYPRSDWPRANAFAPEAVLHDRVNEVWRY